jgi:hypothetical protein
MLDCTLSVSHKSHMHRSKTKNQSQDDHEIIILNCPHHNNRNIVVLQRSCLMLGYRPD